MEPGGHGVDKCAPGGPGVAAWRYLALPGKKE